MHYFKIVFWTPCENIIIKSTCLQSQNNFLNDFCALGVPKSGSQNSLLGILKIVLSEGLQNEIVKISLVFKAKSPHVFTKNTLGNHQKPCRCSKPLIKIGHISLYREHFHLLKSCKGVSQGGLLEALWAPLDPCGPRGPFGSLGDPLWTPF